MSVQITHIRLAGGTGHEHIVRYKWRGIESGKVGESDKPSMVAWIELKKGAAYVGVGASRVNVKVVRPSAGQPYLRTYADGKWTNNLLSLPHF